MPQQSLLLDASRRESAASDVSFARQKYDIAVVGAGPAGAWCAARLAAAGARVALIDPSHPREKPCGGGLTARALALVGDPSDANNVPIRSARFASADREAGVDMAGDASGLRVFSRRVFDEMLVQRAVAEGATWLPERVVDVAADAGGWRVGTRNGTLHAGWLIGADGANSLVRKRVSQPFAREDLSIACGYYLHGTRSSQIDIGFETTPAGYFWSFPRRDHLAVGVCAQADEASVATLMPLVDKWIGHFRLKAEEARFERYSWPIPSLRAETIGRERPAGRRWMLLGDAAGLVDPITREGIFFALQSGEFAAKSLAGGDPEGTYRARLHDEVYAELLLAARIRARFYRPAFIGLLISALQRIARIRDVMADLIAGVQPYRSLRGRLLKTFELKLMLEMITARSSHHERGRSRPRASRVP